MRSHAARFVLIACLLALPVAAWAQGHMLPGAGPTNTAMGGAGVALPVESIGALAFNPALVAGAQGNQITFSTEFYRDSIVIETTSGTRKGTADPSSDLGVVPSFGWMMRNPKGKLALGFGLVGVSGFAVDFPADSASILFAPMPKGFGRIFSDYREMKIPAAFAYQVTPKLAIGASMNIYLASFGIAPLPYTDPDVSATGGRYYPTAGRLTNGWAVSGQFGFYYQATPAMSIGASFTMPQNFGTYRWNSTNADPTSRDFGQARIVEFDLDGPAVLSFGVGLTPNAKTKVAIDGMFTKYTGVHGLGGPGGVVNGVIDPFGWGNVWTFKAGLQQQVTPTMTLRVGYNYSQMPVRPEVVISSVPGPLTFQQHFCGGVGLQMFPFLEAVASFRYAPRHHASGPLPAQPGSAAGTIDMSNAQTSALIGMSFKF